MGQTSMGHHLLSTGSSTSQAFLRDQVWVGILCDRMTSLSPRTRPDGPFSGRDTCKKRGGSSSSVTPSQTGCSCHPRWPVNAKHWWLPRREGGLPPGLSGQLSLSSASPGPDRSPTPQSCEQEEKERAREKREGLAQLVLAGMLVAGLLRSVCSLPLRLPV